MFKQAAFFTINDPLKSQQKRKIIGCPSCGLFATCKTPKMKSNGEGKLKILFIAEAPGRVEDLKGVPLVGDAGIYLRETLEDIGYNLDKDFWKTNAVICRPPHNRTPKTNEIESCRQNLIATIQQYKPRGIILLGAVAFNSLLGGRIKKHLQGHSFSDFIGYCIPDQNLKMWIGVLNHPSYVGVRNEGDKALHNEFKKGLKEIIEKCTTPFYQYNYISDVFIIKDKKEAIKCIKENGLNASVIAEDYETTGIKPHREGHSIRTISFSNGLFAWAFPNFDDSEFQSVWRELQKNDILKVAHNFNFESMWTKQILKYSIGKRNYDTMLAAHCYHNQNRKGLKFLSYVFFGILGYDDSVEKYIKTRKKVENKKSDNAFNCIDEAPIDNLLLYNGLDSLLCYKLYEYFNKSLNRKQKEGLNFLTEGSCCLMEAQQNGIRVDVDYLYEKEKEIKSKLKILYEKIMESEDVKKWNKKKAFKYTSTKDLGHLLFNILKIPVNNYTPSGSPKLDKHELIKIDRLFVKDILEWKKWDKVIDYVDQFKREGVNGFIHPFYQLYTTDTFRSSSSSPNFQNVPKHDKEIKKLIRKAVVPRKGNRLVEYDFKQLEVCISACYNKDPVLIEYILNDDADMHRDQAQLLFMKDDINKEERFIAKNDFVFAEFYGDYYASIAPNLWEDMPDYTRVNLEDHGIWSYPEFEEHVKNVESALWEKFCVYAQWKKDLWKEYLKKGYIYSYTGFKYQGYMTRNKLCNYPIQGAAFHCLLWLLIKITNELKKRKIKKSYIIGQIHDALVMDVHQEDEELIDSLVFYYGTIKIREFWDWIIVPLKIEKERSEINGNWSEMIDCGILDKGIENV